MGVGSGLAPGLEVSLSSLDCFSYEIWTVREPGTAGRKTVVAQQYGCGFCFEGRPSVGEMTGDTEAARRERVQAGWGIEQKEGAGRGPSLSFPVPVVSLYVHVQYPAPLTARFHVRLASWTVCPSLQCAERHGRAQDRCDTAIRVRFLRVVVRCRRRGDAETGLGVDVGAGLAFADPGRGLANRGGDRPEAGRVNAMPFIPLSLPKKSPPGDSRGALRRARETIYSLD